MKPSEPSWSGTRAGQYQALGQAIKPCHHGFVRLMARVCAWVCGCGFGIVDACAALILAKTSCPNHGILSDIPTQRQCRMRRHTGDVGSCTNAQGLHTCTYVCRGESASACHVVSLP